MKVRLTKQGNLWVAKEAKIGFSFGQEIALDIPSGDELMRNALYEYEEEE